MVLILLVEIRRFVLIFYSGIFSGFMSICCSKMFVGCLIFFLDYIMVVFGSGVFVLCGRF